MTCSPIHDPFFCPGKWQLFEQILALLRPGRATQTHEDSSEFAPSVLTPGAPSGLLLAITQAQVRQDVWPRDNPWGTTLSVLQQYWAAFAEVLEYLHQRACALVDEMFCSSARETRAEWAAEYGFPDPCEAYDDICEKVNGIGGATCAYFVALAARRGWTITCSDCEPDAGGAAGDCGDADCSDADCAAGCDFDTIIIDIDLAASPAYATPGFTGDADCAVADCSDVCEPSVEALKCLIERVKPAHVRAIYVVN